VQGVNVYPVASLLDVIDLLNSTLMGKVSRDPFEVKTEETSWVSFSSSPSTLKTSAASRPQSAPSKSPLQAATTFS